VRSAKCEVRSANAKCEMRSAKVKVEVESREENNRETGQTSIVVVSGSTAKGSSNASSFCLDTLLSNASSSCLDLLLNTPTTTAKME
jgi:hypothetical protein